MHYSNLCIIEAPEGLAPTDPGWDEAIEAAVEQVMGPDESGGGFWDWYQIGGRWTGVLDGYLPDEDPKNQEPCEFCKSTGMRNDKIGREMRASDPTFKCNACDGKGTRTKWPTNWEQHPGDVQPIEILTPELLTKFFRVCTPQGAFAGEDYLPWKPLGEMFPKRERPPTEWLKSEFPGHLVVVVDSHC